MTQDLQPSPARRAGPAIVTMLALLVSGLPRVALAQDSEKGEYTWSAELVSLDEQAGTLTVKSRIENRADVEILGDLMEGDDVTLRWTGISWGSGIAAITRDDTPPFPNALMLPVEFVGTEMDDSYVVYRLPIPDASVSELQGLEPGSWVTATSPRNASDPSEAVTEVRPYTDVS